MELDLLKTRKAVKLIIANGEANSQKDLAEKLGYTESAFSQVLKSKQKLSNRFVRNIYNFTNNQQVKDLLEGKEFTERVVYSEPEIVEEPSLADNEFLIKRIEYLEREIENFKKLYVEILRNNTELTTVNVELIRILKEDREKNDRKSIQDPA